MRLLDCHQRCAWRFSPESKTVLLCGEHSSVLGRVHVRLCGRCIYAELTQGWRHLRNQQGWGLGDVLQYTCVPTPSSTTHSAAITFTLLQPGPGRTGSAAVAAQEEASLAAVAADSREVPKRGATPPEQTTSKRQNFGGDGGQLAGRCRELHPERAAAPARSLGSRIPPQVRKPGSRPCGTTASREPSDAAPPPPPPPRKQFSCHCHVGPQQPRGLLRCRSSARSAPCRPVLFRAFDRFWCPAGSRGFLWQASQHG